MKGGRGGDRWLADKGFLVQHILDNRGWGGGVRLETPVKLEGKKQFSEEEDIHNRRTSQARGHILREELDGLRCSESCERIPLYATHN